MTTLTASRMKTAFGRMIAWFFLIFWILLTVVPLWWVVRMAFSTQRAIMGDPTSILPVQPTLDAFKRVLGLIPIEQAIAQGGFTQKLDFLRYLRNTFLVTFFSVGGGLFFNALAAYAFARLRFPGRDKIFALYIGALIMPTVLNLIPNFVLIRSLGWYGTCAGIVAPSFLGSAFGVFFLRQFFLGINVELEDAAKLDGAGTLGIFFRIIMPISLPPLVTVSILTFIDTWNAFQWPYFAGGMGTEPNATVLTVALAAFRAQQQSGLPDFTGMMAGTLISMVPMLVVFLLLGRQAIDKIQFTGIK